MKKLHFLLAVTLVLSLFLLNCKEKENVIPNPNKPTGPIYASVDEVFLQLALKYKTVTIDAGRDTSFYGNSGTRYILSANSLVKMDGTPVTGDVKVEVCEYLDKGDMIFSKVLPISDSQSLLSGGELDIRASQAGQPLRLGSGKKFTANIPQKGEADSNMQLFRGVKVEGEQNQVNWKRVEVKENDKENGMAKSAVDSLSLFSDSMTLCNADKFMTAPGYKAFTVTVKLADGTWTSTEKVLGYAVYDNYKGMWPLFVYYKGVFHETHVPGIPVHFVVFTLINGEFYAGTTGATPENGKNYNVTLTKTDAAAFKAQLNGM